jgi:hypothetical protein
MAGSTGWRVYCRPTPVDAAKAMTWEGVVVSLQTLQKAKFVVGGRRALEVQGFSHYLSSAPQREVHLYGTGTRPGWVRKLNLENQLVFHNAKRLFANDVDLDVDNDSKDPLARSSHTRQKWGKWDWPLVLLSSERAVLELLDEKPELETFQFWSSERHRPPWLDALDRSGIDLGKGKRMLVKGGKLDPKLNITVPESFDGDR